MNARTVFPAAAGALLLQAASLSAVTIEKVLSLSSDKAYLDIYANTEGDTLRTFGVKIQFDSDQLKPTQINRYSGLWFFENENGERAPHTQPSIPSTTTINIIGGRYEVNHPDSGVSGSKVMLATIVFDRLGAVTPDLEIGLAHDSNFASFTTIDGTIVDTKISGLGTSVSTQKLSEDSDKDGIPDADELAIFGNLTSSKGKESDFDKDRASDYDEWLAGTDPKDANSKLKIEIMPQANGEMMVQWESSENRYYELQVCDSLTSFSPMMSGVSGNGKDKAVMLEPQGGREFYRIKVDYPSAGR